MNDSKCFFTALTVLYSKRLLNGYMCDLDQLWRDIVAFRRLIRLEENIKNCRLRGSVVDEMNKLRNKLAKTYNMVCPDC